MNCAIFCNWLWTTSWNSSSCLTPLTRQWRVVLPLVQAHQQDPASVKVCEPGSCWVSEDGATTERGEGRHHISGYIFISGYYIPALQPEYVDSEGCSFLLTRPHRQDPASAKNMLVRVPPTKHGRSHNRSVGNDITLYRDIHSSGYTITYMDERPRVLDKKFLLLASLVYIHVNILYTGFTTTLCNQFSIFEVVLRLLVINFQYCKCTL